MYRATSCQRLVLPSLALASLLFIAAQAAFSQAGTGTIRVTTTGSDFTGCGSAATPCETPNFAVNQAEPAGDVVKVAAGTYSTTATCSGEPAVLCMLNDHGTIQGGFSGGDWDNPNPSANPTVFDGLDSARVVRVQDGGPALPNTASLTLEGVTLTRGFREGAASGTDTEVNAFGGCVDAVNAPLFFTDVVISDCHARGGGTSGSDHGGAGAGGGIALRGFAENIQTSIFERVRFEDNLVEGGSRTDGGNVRGGYAQGGGIFIFRATLQGIDITFVNNRAEAGDASSAIGIAGGQRADAQGAAINVNVGGNATLTGVVSTGNQCLGGDASNSGGFGGGAFGPALYAELGALTVTDFDARENSSLGGAAESGGLGAGGAFMTTSSTVELHRGVFVNNESRGGPGTSNAGSAGGGAVYLANTQNFEMSNLIVGSNVADEGTTGAVPGGGGGGFFLQNSSGTLDHITLAGNSIGTVMQGEAMVLIGGSSATLAYSIVSDHSGTGNGRALYTQPGNTLTLEDGIFSANSQDTNNGEGSSGTFIGLGTMTSETSVDYVDPGSPDFDYHILSSSPAIDAATGSTETLDVDGDTRTNPDTGADELNALPDEIFSDGFESGNTSAWSSTVG
ncbi:MAG: hypothetical protein MPN21_14975 [Thermoanaerobaculia bacterium]|nr:hypothetical protein [Thermoanaerobaculia bacterium]